MIYIITFNYASKAAFISDVLHTYITNNNIQVFQYINTIPNMIKVNTIDDFNINTIIDTSILYISDIEHDDGHREAGYIRNSPIDVPHPFHRTYFSAHATVTANPVIGTTTPWPLPPYSQTDGYHRPHVGTAMGTIVADPLELPINWAIPRCTMPNDILTTSSAEIIAYEPPTEPEVILHSDIEWTNSFDTTSGTDLNPGEYTTILKPDEPIIPEIHGCADPDANNFNPNANIDNGTCTFESTETTPGCMDSTAINYNPDADVSDGTCVFTTVDITGCMDPTAINYNPSANIDGDNCVFSTTTISGIDTQVISLSPGWNMISSYIDIESLNYSSFTALVEAIVLDDYGNPYNDVGDAIQVIKNVSGQFWSPAFSQLTGWENHRGYMVYAKEQCMLSITGPVISTMTISLTYGWNMIAFPFIESRAISDTFTGQLDNIQVVKNVAGQFWSATYAQINTLYPGQGYMVYVTHTDGIQVPVFNNVDNVLVPTVEYDTEQVISIGAQEKQSSTSVISSYINNSNRTLQYIFENYLYDYDNVAVPTSDISSILEYVQDMTTYAKYSTTPLGEGVEIDETILGPAIYTQEIQLNIGWNMVSTYIDIPSLNYATFGDILEAIVVDVNGNAISDISTVLSNVKKDNGDFWSPAASLLTAWESNVGYYVYAKEPCMFKIIGPPIQDITINIPEGVTLVAFPSIENMLITDAFTPQDLESITQITNTTQFWSPAASQFNTLEPGSGYKFTISSGNIVPLEIHNSVVNGAVPDMMYNSAHAYLIKWVSAEMRSAGYKLIIPGDTVINTSIDIPAGWSSIPIPSSTEVVIEQVFAEAIANGWISQIKDPHTAATYWTEFGFNGIGNLIPGKVYEVKSSESYTIII